MTVDIERIQSLKKEANAIILAHNYQLAEVQDIADHVGDSFGLSVIASKTDANIIVFCGVKFMAESAQILSPNKIVLHPEPGSKCPMAAMVEPEPLRALKAKHPDAKVVSYVNTTAEVKAESDYCCTSANAVKVVEHADSQTIIFTPDQNLGKYIKRFAKKEIHLWPGYCATHAYHITVSALSKLKNEHPDAEILVHPECTPGVIDFADKAFSTSGMMTHAQKSERKEFIIGTEYEMLHPLKKAAPDKIFYGIKEAICPNMKKITLEKIQKSLETFEPKINLEPDIIEKARIPLERMIEIGRQD